MTNYIKLLPDNVANQIAAGEVVQRPSSVVKELIENAIDAQATEITLIIQEGGKAWIEVIDNGTGMSELDARMCFERHATSKIEKADDLFKILTMGFRGEALSSIAAVAQVELKTNLNSLVAGTRILIEGSEIKSQEPCALEKGTRIIVKNLFNNVPARRNFLKSTPLETRHIYDTFVLLALSRPDIEFLLFNNDTQIYNFKIQNLESRLIALFGAEYRNKIIHFDESIEQLKISGFIGSPELSKKMRGEQFLYVNNRFIKSPSLNHAIISGYEMMISPDTFPFYVINIIVLPQRIDVNIHPTKTEIKFEDERTVYALVKNSVKKALGNFHISPVFSSSVGAPFSSGFTGFPDSKITNESPFIKSDPSDNNWQMLYESNQTNPSDKEINIKPDLFSSSGTEISRFPKIVPVNSDYSILINEKGITIIHLLRVQKRIYYEKILSLSKQKESSVKKLLFPKTIQINHPGYKYFLEQKNYLKTIGFDIEEFGNNALIIHGFPDFINENQLEEIVISFLSEDSEINTSSNLSGMEKIALKLSKKVVLKSSFLNSLQIEILIEGLKKCRIKEFCPEGFPIFVHYSFTDLEEKFNQKTKNRKFD